MEHPNKEKEWGFLSLVIPLIVLCFYFTFFLWGYMAPKITHIPRSSKDLSCKVGYKFCQKLSLCIEPEHLALSMNLDKSLSAFDIFCKNEAKDSYLNSDMIEGIDENTEYFNWNKNILWLNKILIQLWKILWKNKFQLMRNLWNSQNKNFILRNK